MIYTLMNAEHEVLDFDFDEDRRIRGISIRDGFKYAPIHLGRLLSEPEKLKNELLDFLLHRTICFGRADIDDIYAATGVNSGIKLALRSCGLSLTDQYWYRPEGSRLKWEDINCFDNEFDTSFGEAILRRDYDALAKADPLTPDCTLDGITRKAWIRVKGKPMLLKSEVSTSDFTIQSEMLASRLTERLLNEGDYISYTRREFGGETYIACPPMVKRNEEFIPARHVLACLGTRYAKSFMEISKDDNLLREFTDGLEGLGIENITRYYAKLTAAFNLCLAGDCHTYNFGFIRDLETMKLRAAPLFDRGRSFGSFGQPNEEGIDSAAVHALKSPVGVYMFMLMHSSLMKPDWDYGWYDPKRLDGFEDDIERMISVSEAIPREYVEMLKIAYRYQLDYLNKAAGKSK